MSPVPPQPAARPPLTKREGHRLTLTVFSCEIRSQESPAFGLGVLRAGRTGDAGDPAAACAASSVSASIQRQPCGGRLTVKAARPAYRDSGEHRPTALGARGVLHGLDALLDRLKSRSEHGSGQLGYALAIADSGFDPFLDKPLLKL